MNAVHKSNIANSLHSTIINAFSMVNNPLLAPNLFDLKTAPNSHIVKYFRYLEVDNGIGGGSTFYNPIGLSLTISYSDNKPVTATFLVSKLESLRLENELGDIVKQAHNAGFCLQRNKRWFRSEQLILTLDTPLNENQIVWFKKVMLSLDFPLNNRASGENREQHRVNALRSLSS
jgi:hypothetical protein